MRIPTVSIGGHLSGVDSLVVDEEAVGRLATEHLISLGHTQIAHVGGENESLNCFSVSRARRDGYTAAMTAAGLEQRSAWSVVGDYTINGAYAEAKSLLADLCNRLTGIVCASDEMAVGTIVAARDLGICIPEQVSVIGVDCHPLGEVFGLTTIDQFASEQGKKAVGTLLARLGEHPDQNTATESTTISMPIKIVARSSTAAPGCTGPSGR